jgi:hypothetical protein
MAQVGPRGLRREVVIDDGHSLEIDEVESKEGAEVYAS